MNKVMNKDSEADFGCSVDSFYHKLWPWVFLEDKWVKMFLIKKEKKKKSDIYQEERP